MFSILRRVGFVAAAFSALVLFVSAAEYGGIGARPAVPDPSQPNGDSWFVYSLPPGAIHEDAVELQNTTSDPQDVLVYAADSTPSSDGGFALKQYSEAMIGVGSWVRFYPSDPPAPANRNDGVLTLCGFKTPPATRQPLPAEMAAWCTGTTAIELTLAPNSTHRVGFVITIPDSLNAGEHTGGIVLQKRQAETQATEGSALILTTRVGVRIYETLPGEIRRELRFTRFSITRNGRLREYTITVGLRNEGNVSVRHTLRVHVDDRLFRRPQPAIERQQQVLREDELTTNFAWRPPIIGVLRFQAIATYDGAQGPREIRSVPVVLWVIPWAAVIGILGAVGIAVTLWLLVRARRRRQRRREDWRPYVIQVDDDLDALARRFGVSWRLLVRVNRIRPPYRLEEGKTILVPFGHLTTQKGVDD